MELESRHNLYDFMIELLLFILIFELINEEFAFFAILLNR